MNALGKIICTKITNKNHIDSIGTQQQCTYGLYLDMRQNLAYIPSLFLMPGSMSMSRLAAFKSNVC